LLQLSTDRYNAAFPCLRNPGLNATSSQAKFSPEELINLSEILDIPIASLQGGLGEHWWPNRGLGPVPPADPVIYRLYEVGPATGWLA
jgi:cyanate lyase